MKRRKFIKATIIGGAAIGLIIFFNWQKGSKWKKLPLMVPGVLSRFCDEETLRIIGETYLKNSPSENSKTKLSNLISNGISKTILDSNDYDEISRQLEMKVRQDFVLERLIVVNGWILSETEVYQCALISLS
jgi:hypothetical protein